MTPAEEKVFLAEVAEADARLTAEHERHVRWAINKSILRWRSGARCGTCGEWIGHWGGPFGAYKDTTDTRPRCKEIPDNVWLEELRPNCFDVRRFHIGDAIRAHCKS